MSLRWKRLLWERLQPRCFCFMPAELSRLKSLPQKAFAHRVRSYTAGTSLRRCP